MKHQLQCAGQHVPWSNLTKYCAWHAKWRCKISEKMFANRWNVISNAGTIREWSEHETVSPQPASQPRLLFELTTSIFYWKMQHFAPRLTFKNSPSAAPATKSHTWTSPSAAPATKSDTWTSPSATPATKSDTWTSPSAAPATQNHFHDQSSSHMKRYLQCAEQHVPWSNLTKYRGWGRKMTLQNFRENACKQMKRYFQCGDDPRMIRAWNRQSATRLATEVISRPGLHSKTHQVHLPRKVTLELHQVLHLPRKVTLELHQVLHLPRKVTLELHQVLHLPRKVTLELHQVLHLPRKVTLELHQVLHLPRKVTLELHQVLHLPR